MTDEILNLFIIKEGRWLQFWNVSRIEIFAPNLDETCKGHYE